MSALQSLRVALGSLGRNPVLFLVGLAYGLVTLPQSALQLAGVQFAPTILQAVTFFVTPFFIAGIIGMAAESLDGDTSLSTLRRVGRDRYVPLLVAKFVEIAIVIALAIVGGILVAIGVVLSLAVVGNPVVAAAVGGLVALVFAVVFFFIQFFPVAVSLGDADAVDSFRRSVRLVRRNLVSTLGYSIIGVLVALVTTLPITGALLYEAVQNLDQLQNMQGGGMGPGANPAFQALQLSTGEIALLSVISLAVTMLLFTFKQTYATAFYRDHAPPVGGGDVRTAGPGAGVGESDAPAADEPRTGFDDDAAADDRF